MENNISIKIEYYEKFSRKFIQMGLSKFESKYFNELFKFI